MQRHAVPSEREKKAWPRESSSMLRVTLEKSGLNRNSTPLPAPGRAQEATTMTSNRMKRMGMSVLLNFSMPLRTPRMTTRWVMTMNTRVHTSGSSGSEENDLKYSVT